MQQSEILISVVAFLFVGFIGWIISVVARAKMRHRAEMQKELLARFSTSQELSDFLNSDAGKQLLFREEDLRAKADIPRSERASIGYTIGYGVLFLCVGVAILIAGGSVLVGAIFTALGVGNLINALLRIYLTRKWGCGDQPVPASKTNVP